MGGIAGFGPHTAAVTVNGMRKVEVHLVRHGQSTWNVERRLQGQTPHPPLTAQGHLDAARAAERLVRVVGEGPVSVVSSDLVRAAQTADIIATELSESGAALAPRHVSFTEALREQHLGAMEGRLTKELRPEPVPEGMHISEVRWADGESLADVHARLQAYFASVLPHAPGHLVVITHGDTLRVARSVLTGRTHRDVEWDVVPNGAVITIACGDDVADTLVARRLDSGSPQGARLARRAQGTPAR